MPPAILHANKIFISNGGADSSLFPVPFSGEATRPYSEFYAALAANRSYKLLGDPSQVDLSLEISLTSFGITYLNSAPSGYPQDPIAMFRLKIYDSANHKLWTMTQPVDFALLQKNRDHNFDDAITALLLQFLQVAGKAPASAAPAAEAH